MLAWLTPLQSSSYCSEGQNLGGLDNFVSKLDEAEKRLQRALSGLEEAAGTLVRGGSESLNSIEDDLQAARIEVRKLRAQNIFMAEKLDDTIQRIKGILEN